MQSKFNLYILEYAMDSMLRNRFKNISILIIFISLIFLLSSVLFISNSIKYELDNTVDNLPEITIQKIKAGRIEQVDISMVDNISKIRGVEDVIPRVWGYYYFRSAGVNFTIMGLDGFATQYTKTLEEVSQKFDIDSLDNGMIIGKGVEDILKSNYYSKYFNFITPKGELKKINIAGVFKSQTQLESNDMIILSQDNAKEIFDIKNNKASDIVVKVANPKEIQTIVSKIRALYPDTRIITKEDLKVSYQNIFNYKRGLFLAIFIISIFTFFIIIYDKISGISNFETKEIGILKAIGWRVDDILKEKFYEAFIISSLSFIIGISISLWFVYTLQAPLLKEIFIGYSNLRPVFKLPFIIDYSSLSLVFLLSIPIYISASIIPSWRVATNESDEVMR
jgi:ABC-type lipoprotein release transport system permease subunit